MSRLFEEMQEARRRGELAVPEEEPTPEPEPEPVVVEFYAHAEEQNRYDCLACGAVVASWMTDRHYDWHQRAGV